MNDRSPSPRSSRGLSTLCPPRLFGIGDRRHGQSVVNPASRSAIDPAGDRFQCRRGSSCRRGQFPMALDTGRTSPFSCEVGLDRLRTEHRALPSWSAVSTPNETSPISLGASLSCRMMRLVAWIRRGDVCLGGWSPMAAVVGGVPHRLPAAPWGQQGAVPWTRRGRPRQRRADAGAAFRAPTKTEHRPIQKASRPGAAARRTSPFSCGGGQPGTLSTAVLWAGPRRAHWKRWKRAMFRRWTAQIQASPHRH